MAGLGSLGRMLLVLLISISLLGFGLWIALQWPEPDAVGAVLLLVPAPGTLDRKLVTLD